MPDTTSLSLGIDAAATSDAPGVLPHPTVRQSVDLREARQKTLDNVTTYTVGSVANPVTDIAGRYDDLVKKPDPSSMRREAHSPLLATAAALLTVAGCTPTAPPSPRPTPPAVERWGGLLAGTRAQWTAESGINLQTGPAVVVRAYRESIDLAQATGNLDFVYPGFTTAVLPNDPDSPRQSAWDRWPSLSTPETTPVVGNLGSHILSIDGTGDNVRAVVCAYTYSTATEIEAGQYKSRVASTQGPDAGIAAYLVEMKAPGQEAIAALPVQQGPEPAPLDDVFGGWKVTGALNSFAYSGLDLAREWPAYQSDLAACVEKAPDPPDRRSFLTTGKHRRSDFPAFAPAPGWPAESR
jgi:hypothetical protein